MARYSLRELEVAKISKKMPSCYRYRLQDSALSNSVKKSGILMPLIVTGGGHPVVIAGHKRFIAACESGLREVAVLEAGRLSFQDAFILNLVSNWRQGCSEMDRAQAVSLATGELAFKEADVLEMIMPLLGLPPERDVLELYRKTHDLTSSLKDLFDDGELPFRGVTFFVKLSRADQEYFAKEVGKCAKLTSSQLLQTGEWLADLVKSTGKDLKRLFHENKISEVLDHTGMDPRTKADKFFDRIKKLRFPGYQDYLEKFESRTRPVLREAKNLRLLPVEGFEERGFEIQARIKAPADLDALLKKLSKERSSLNSLFDVML